MSKVYQILEITEQWLLDFGVFGLFTYQEKFSKRFDRSSLHPATDDNALKRFFVAGSTIINITALIILPTIILAYFLDMLGLNPHISLLYLFFAIAIFLFSFIDLLLKIHSILSE